MSVEQRDDLDQFRSRQSPQGPWRRFLRGFVHFFSYHLILSQKRTRITRAAGFRLIVPPTVFHPRYFLTSEYFARFIGGLDLAGKCVADVGTGSGILAMAAVRAGAPRAVAIDINPNAAGTAGVNARANGLDGKVSPLVSDLLANVPPGERFDVIFSSPPSFAGEPRDLADRAWHAGPDYRDIADLFGQARELLAPGGRMYLLVSTDSDLTLLGRLIREAGFDARLVHERSIWIESFLIYELTLPAAEGATTKPGAADPSNKPSGEEQPVCQAGHGG